MSKHALQIPAIEQMIFFIRGHKVMLDSHLAELYEVKTRILIRNVKRSLDRFPIDFMFQLEQEEWENLRSQIGISSSVNIQIMRAFTKLREYLTNHHDLQEQIKKLEEKFDENYAVVFHAIQLLLDGPVKKVKVKGFGK